MIRHGILIAIVCCLANTGCFVVTSNHVSKPVGSPETVEFRAEPYDEAAEWYVNHLHSPDLDFDIAVYNNAMRLEMPFFLWVLPLPNPQTYIPTNLDVQVNFRPAEGKTVTFDPSRIEFISTNGIAVAPAKVFEYDESRARQIVNGVIQITRPEHFRFEYETPCNPDDPFELSIAGAFLPSQRNLPSAIHYERSKIVRAGFRLPY